MKVDSQKEESFERLYDHFILGVNDYEHMSRLERLEYAYTALNLSKTYLCYEYGISPKTIKTGFVRNYNKNNSIPAGLNCSNSLGLSYVSLDINLQKFFPSIEGLYKTIFHEIGHTIDDKIYHNSSRLPTSLGYSTKYGIGWLASEKETFADTIGFEFLHKLINRAIQLNPENDQFIAMRDSVLRQYSNAMQKHFEAKDALTKEFELKQKGQAYRKQEEPIVEDIRQRDKASLPLYMQNNAKMIEACCKTENRIHWLTKLFSRKDCQLISLEAIRRVSQDPELKDIMTTRDFIAKETYNISQQEESQASQLNSLQQEILQNEGRVIDDNQTVLKQSIEQEGESSTIVEIIQSEETQYAGLSPDAQRDLEYFKLAENPTKANESVEDNSAVQSLELNLTPPTNIGGDE